MFVKSLCEDHVVARTAEKSPFASKNTWCLKLHIPMKSTCHEVSIISYISHLFNIASAFIDVHVWTDMSAISKAQ